MHGVRVRVRVGSSCGRVEVLEPGGEDPSICQLCMHVCPMGHQGEWTLALTQAPTLGLTLALTLALTFAITLALTLADTDELPFKPSHDPPANASTLTLTSTLTPTQMARSTLSMGRGTHNPNHKHTPPPLPPCSTHNRNHKHNHHHNHNPEVHGAWGAEPITHTHVCPYPLP